MTIVFIDGPFGVGKTTLMREIKEYARSSGYTDISFIEEGFLNFDCQFEKNSAEWNLSYAKCHIEACKTSKGRIVFVDSSSIMTYIYHSEIKLEDMINLLNNLIEDYTVYLWMIWINEVSHYKRVRKRLIDLSTSNHDEFSKRVSIGESSHDHLLNIRSMVYSSPILSYYDEIWAPEILLEIAKELI